MGDKEHTLLIKVDLKCCRCRQAIEEYLCRIQRKENILAITYDEKNNVVSVSGPFNPELLKRKLLCKFPKVIEGIDIKKPTKPPEPPKKDEMKEKYLKKCMEKYEEIVKCMEKCKKECEEKCRKECEDKFECESICKCESKFKCECKCKCERKCKCKGENNPPEGPPAEAKEKLVKPQPALPQTALMFPLPPGTLVCCARPCPCFANWCNNYRCCSCGWIGWPRWCEPGGGLEPCSSSRPQGGCEPGRLPSFVLESAQPSCSIM